MDLCQSDGIDESKIPNDVHHETNMKSIKHISIKKNLPESDHRTPKRKSDISNLNTLKKRKKYETALAAIFPENDQSYLQYAQDYAEGYMKKLREKLDSESFDQAIKLLASFGDADDSNINLLYQQIKEVFTDKNEDLIYEFLGFLLPGQALSIGKFTDYLELTRIKEFIRKLQVCMKKQQTQVRKILDNLFHLSKNENITLLEIHTVMLPLLKSNPILVDCFFQLIPTEHPPESFFSDDNWEDLDVDQSVNYGIDYEEITPSDSEDHTILNICHCICHKLGNNAHCRSCGLKFFKGRIYFDTQEGLKLAKINFEGADSSIVQSKIDKTKENITTKQKNRKNLIKNNSPSSAEDIKGSTGTESEEDLIDVKPKKRQKSKVVQSLKLKFKKEEISKSKDDQDTNNESVKSIVHVNNEELNSSEMVFFCIPKGELNEKMLPKKRLKVDIKENSMCQELETFNSSDINSVLCENNNGINTINNIQSKPKSEINSTSHINENVKEEDIKYEQHQIPNINIKLTSQSLTINNDLSVNSNVFMPQNNLEESCEHVIKKELNEHSNTSNIINKKQCESPNTLMPQNDLKEFNEHSNTSNINNKKQCESSNTLMPLNDLEESYEHVIKKEFDEHSDTSDIINKKQCESPNTVTKLINESEFDKNITIKNEAIDNLSKRYVDIEKPENNTTEIQLANEWTIDEDKIILQTCKRVEDIEVLLETINRRIPQRSVSEIQERFTTLMTLLEQMIDVKQH